MSSFDGPVRNPKPAVFNRMVGLGLAAGLGVLAIGFALTGPVTEPPAVTPTQKPPRKPAVVWSVPVRPPSRARVDEPARQPLSEPVRDLLARFYLNDLALERVPLQKAAQLLMERLRTDDAEARELLPHLRLSVPTAVASRLVSFRTGAMPFLNALESVAGLVGCELRQTDETTLELASDGQRWPQAAVAADLLDVLRGLQAEDGLPAWQDESRLAELLVDARSLGIELDATQPGWHLARLTSGQRQALQAMTKAREAVRQLPLPEYELQFTDDPAVAATDSSVPEAQEPALVDTAPAATPASSAPPTAPPPAPLAVLRAADARQAIAAAGLRGPVRVRVPYEIAGRGVGQLEYLIYVRPTAFGGEMVAMLYSQVHDAVAVVGQSPLQSLDLAALNQEVVRMATGETEAQTAGLMAAISIDGLSGGSIDLMKTGPVSSQGLVMRLAEPTGLPAGVAAEMAALADAAAGAVLTPVTPGE